MTKLTRWMDLHTDPTGKEHPAEDAATALHTLLIVCLWIITFVVVVGAIVWFFTLPTGNGELAPAVGTTTTEGG